jgi:nitrogenase molybdenum-iron protein alpha/beta subunit
MTDQTLINNILTVANTTELVKKTIAKVGLEFIAPLDESVQDEKISKAILARVKGDSK